MLLYTIQVLDTSDPVRPIQFDTNSTCLKYSAMLQLLHKHYALCPELRNSSKGDSNWGAVERTKMSRASKQQQRRFELGRRGANENVPSFETAAKEIRTGAPWRERKCPELRISSKGDSNWGAVERTKMSRASKQQQRRFELGRRGENENVPSFESAAKGIRIRALSFQSPAFYRCATALH